MQSALQIEQLVKHYPKHTALNGVSFEVAQGEFFGLLGPNGAGKTTLISILAGLTRASSGMARVMGYEVAKDPLRTRQLLGVVPQEIAFDPFFSVRETLRWQSGYFGIAHNDDWIDELLHHLGLTDKADTNMRALSGGMKRRVLVAQALVHKPQVIILDEPTAGVDVELRQSLWAFISRLHTQGHTIVLTTHYLEEAEQLCDRIAILKTGELVALDKTSTLLRQLAGVHLNIKTAHAISANQLPASLLSSLNPTTQNGTRWHFTLADAQAVEPGLAALRLANIAIEDIQVTQADLEDVFVRMVHNKGDAS